MITFRPLTRADFPLLGRWLADPEVATWWHHDASPEGVERDFGPTVDGRDPSYDVIAELDGRPFGLLQFCRFTDFPEYVAELEPVYPVGPGIGSIDYLIGEPGDRGRGLGSEVLDAFSAHVLDRDPTLDALVVPVNSANVASWKALLRAGFRLVARGEMEPDNPVHDRLHEILRRDREPSPRRSDA